MALHFNYQHYLSSKTMSLQSNNEVMYFHCPEFAITMPVSECQTRRKPSTAVQLEKKRISSVDISGDSKRFGYMRSKCLSCVKFRDHTHPDKLITSEQMLAHMSAIPSQKPSAIIHVKDINFNSAFKHRRQDHQR